MEPTFSEFSYGYALTEELASGRLGFLTGAPIFPSLHQEGQSGGGYDLQLPLAGVPLFFQFKLSHYLHRSYSLQWYLFLGPYYRMYLRPLRYSDQHNLLLDLEGSGNEVYYVAPEFHMAEELNEAYINGYVIERSAFFSPLDIGALDDYPHYVVFSSNSSVAYLCSEEPRKPLRFSFGKEFVKQQHARIRERRTEVNDAFFRTLIDEMISVLDRKAIKTERIKQFRDELTRGKEGFPESARLAAYLARAYFDAQLFIIGERNH